MGRILFMIVVMVRFFCGLDKLGMKNNFEGFIMKKYVNK